MSEGATVWPSRFPRCAFAGAALACLAGWGLYRLWSQSHPEQAFYLSEYATTSVYSWGKARQFDVLLPDGTPTTALLSPVGFNRWMEKDIYHSQPVWASAEWHLYAFGFMFLVGLIGGGILDAKIKRAARKGRVLRGPRIVGWRKFNWLTWGDGLKIPCAPGKFIRFRKDREDHHFLLCGVSGTGKSTLMAEKLDQIEARGEVAVIFDPEQEFAAQRYDESRGDIIFNAMDARCPYWPIGEEVTNEAESVAVANALLPESPTDTKFFNKGARAILAYLFTAYRPDCATLGYWLANTKEISRRLVNTPQAHALPEKASPGQAAAVLAELSAPALSLRLMPGNDGRRRWTAEEWVKKRKGWIFVTSTPSSMDALRPLQSLLLDLLLLKLQSDKKNTKRVWFFIDEMKALDKLPQAEPASTRGRKYGISLVLGFQGISQIEKTYGDKDAQTILSQPFHNIVLRTREPRAAKLLSDLLGKQDIERVTESVQSSGFFGWGSKRSYSTQIAQDQPVVTASEISDLDDLHGYVKVLGNIVPITFQPRKRPARAEGFIPREDMLPEILAAPEPDAEPEEELLQEPVFAAVAAKSRPKRHFRPATEEPSLFN